MILTTVDRPGHFQLLKIPSKSTQVVYDISDLRKGFKNFLKRPYPGHDNEFYYILSVSARCIDATTR